MEIDRIVCGEAAETMSRFLDNCIDLTVTSPPYDNLRTYNGYTFDFETIAQQLYRVTKPGGVVVWVVGDATKNGSESGTSFKQALGFMATGFNLHDTMIYQVQSTGAKGSNYAYWQSFEYMFVFSKGKIRQPNLIHDIKPINKKKTFNAGRKDEAGKTKTRTRSSLPKGGLSKRGNVWRFWTGYNQYTTTGHPAPFPEALARDHILSWSNPGDLVLDPLMGSGTTCKMAMITGRHYLGIDISAEYCELAHQRLERVSAELRGELNHLPMFQEIAA